MCFVLSCHYDKIQTHVLLVFQLHTDSIKRYRRNSLNNCPISSSCHLSLPLKLYSKHVMLFAHSTHASKRKRRRRLAPLLPHRQSTPELTQQAIRIKINYITHRSVANINFEICTYINV